MFVPLIAKTFEEPKVAADTTIPIVTPLATPATSISAMPLAPVSTMPSAQVPVVPIAPILTSPSTYSSFPPLPYFFIINALFLLYGFSHNISCSLSGPTFTTPSQFEVGSNSATVPDLVSEAATFFTNFD